jgi:uncharacterized membrane protein
MSLPPALRQRDNFLLLTLLVIAFFLRFFRLGFESFWMDEIYVMNEADPHQPLSTLFFYLKCCDQHPPLYYLASRCVFFLFGQSEVSARLLSALAGVAGVWAMYLLGKEILNKRLGLLAAALTCVNHFCLHYSREARGYSFVFLFAALSLLWLFRLIKYLRVKDVWYFALFSLLTIHSHYFGLFFVFGQYCAAMVLFWPEKEKKVYARRFILSGLIIAAGLCALIPLLQGLTGIHSFWIGSLPGDWMLRFFGNYFSNSNDLAVIMGAFLTIYTAGVFIRRRWKWSDGKQSPLLLSSLVLWTTIIFTLGIPYIRSVLMVPMLLDRYTIVILPALLVAIAYGIELVPLNIGLKLAGFCFLIGLSLYKEVGVLKIYSKHYKTQFREITAYMAKDPAANHYPVVNDHVPWFETYYLRTFGYPGALLDRPKAEMIDSLVSGNSAPYKTDGFWLMDGGAVGAPENFLDPASRRKVDSLFVKVKEQKYLDTWAELYLRKTKESTTANRIP